jgi:multicomponent Na+:H+ antiporter subunit E
MPAPLASDIPTRRPWIGVLLRAATFAALWWMLTGAASASWAVGTVVIVLAVAASLHLQPVGRFRISLAALPGLAIFFLVKSVQGGVQVALMAIRPRLDLQPAMMEMRLRLADEPARIFLASLLNLMPGTLSTGLEGDRLTLHVLDARLPIESAMRTVEARVARVFRQALP